MGCQSGLQAAELRRDKLQADGVHRQELSRQARWAWGREDPGARARAGSASVARLRRRSGVSEFERQAGQFQANPRACVAIHGSCELIGEDEGKRTRASAVVPLPRSESLTAAARMLETSISLLSWATQFVLSTWGTPAFCSCR